MKIKGLHDHTTPTCNTKCIVVFHFEYEYLYSGSQYIQNMTENFQSKSARTLYIYINMSTA